jgi:hypothetical protein
VTSEVTAEAASDGAYGWRLAGTANAGAAEQRVAYGIDSKPTMNEKVLLGGVTFGFDVRPVTTTPGAELWITVPFSTLDRETPGLEANTVYFYHSDQDYSYLNDDAHSYVRIEAEPGAWTSVDVDLTDLARRVFPTQGDDQHAEFVRVELRAWDAAGAVYDLDAFRWTLDTIGEDLRDLQEDWLELEEPDSVQIIGAEITFTTSGHFNAFGEAVPLLSYAVTDAWDGTAAVDFVHQYGGIVSYNHMFGVSSESLDDVGRAEAVASRITELTDAQVYGADLLEVGYRQRTCLIQDFLEVWDALSMSGVWITGIGTSDEHNLRGPDVENNFVTWARSASTDEADLQWNLERGAAWFGDPTAFPEGEVEVTLTAEAPRATMGQVVVGWTEPVEVVFTADPLAAGWVVNAVEDGVVVASTVVPSGGAFSSAYTVDPLGGRVLRFEVVPPGEPSGVLYTNPIYFVDTAVDLPQERAPAP